MEKRHQQKTALILKYAKRRFDGGNEVELIRSIERQGQTDQLNRMYNGVPQAEVPAAGSVPVTPVNQQPAATPNAELKFSPMTEAILMGPLQLSVGAVGMLTSALAIVTFRQAKNEVMVKQAQQVFSDCAKTFQKGLCDLIATPVRVFKASRSVKKA